MAGKLKRSLYANGPLNSRTDLQMRSGSRQPPSRHQQQPYAQQQNHQQRSHNQQPLLPTPTLQQQRPHYQQPLPSMLNPQQQHSHYQQPLLPKPTTQQPTANPWQQQNLPPPMQPSPSGVEELLNAMGNFLQKWHTQPQPNSTF